MFWDVSDGLVSYNGCCSSGQDIGSHQCCCEIGKHMQQCVNAPEIFAAWRKANVCQGSISAGNDSAGGSCEMGSGCASHVEFCTYTGHAHREWSSIPEFMATRVVKFFASQL